VEYVRPMSCKRRVAKVTGLQWAEWAEKKSETKQPSARNELVQRGLDNALEAVPKAFLPDGGGAKPLPF
jgi:hypothetical protein